MISVETRMRVADNSGAREIQCIRVLGGTRRKYVRVGDIFVASVKSALPAGNVKKKEVVRAVLVRAAQPWRRADGTTIRFDDNAAVILENAKTPKGTRIFGPVARELRDRKYTKIVSMASEIV